MKNMARAGVRTFRSGNTYAAITADGFSKNQYHVRLFSRRGGGPVYFLQESGCAARSAHEAASMAFDVWSQRHPEDIEASDDDAEVIVREVTDLSRVTALDGLGAFDPKVIEGGFAKKKPEDVLPSDPRDLAEWERGFHSALESKPSDRVVLGPTVATPLQHLSREWRAGYEAGRRVRGKLWLEQVVLAFIKKKRRNIETAQQEMNQRIREQALRTMREVQGPAREAMPRRGSGGPAQPYKRVIETFATSYAPAHTTRTPGGKGYFSLWIDPSGRTLYSYGQPIATKKDLAGTTVYVDPRTFSRTSSRQQSYLRFRLQHHGWEIIERELSVDGEG